MSGTTTRRMVWGIGTTRTLRVHWALIELGLDYETVPVRPRTPDLEADEFLLINPRKKVPVLKDGDLILTESPAIVTYLAETYSTETRRLIPVDPHDRARYFEWLSFIAMELDATSLYVLRRHFDLTETYGEAPLANAAAREYFDRMIKAAAPVIAAPGGYLLGRSFSGADIMLQSCFNLADRYDVTLPAELADYRARVTARPAYAKAMEANTP